MVVNISKAARLASKTRRTIYKHINQGKLSTSRDSKGNRGIDLTELIRVYGDDVKQPGTEKKIEGTQSGGTSVSSIGKVDLLLKKIEDLESEIYRLAKTVNHLNNRLEYKPDLPGKDEITNPEPRKSDEVSSLMARLKAKQVKTLKN